MTSQNNLPTESGQVHWALLATCEPRVNHVESPPVKVTQTKKDYSPLKRIMLFSYAAERF